MKNKQILNLGSGTDKSSDLISLDINPVCKPDFVHDLNIFPYPFKSNTFSKIKAFNILEHLDNLIKVMEEIHRIAKPNARVEISTGHFSGCDSFTDLTHKHFFASRSFDYFVPGTDLYKYHYSKIKFKIVDIRLGPIKTGNIFLNIILLLINKYRIFYEKRLAFIFPVGVISYKLKVIK